MTKQKQQDNPKFSFLFGGENYSYYQYKVQTEQASKSTPHPLYKIVAGSLGSEAKSMLVKTNHLHPNQNVFMYIVLENHHLWSVLYIIHLFFILKQLYFLTHLETVLCPQPGYIELIYKAVYLPYFSVDKQKHGLTKWHLFFMMLSGLFSLYIISQFWGK